MTTATDDRTNSARAEPLGDLLVVEDAPASLQLLTEVLSCAGYSVRPFLDGGLALASARAEPPDLALLEIRAPSLDGFEVCRRLKADARTRDVPVLFLSSLQGAAEKLQGFKLGGVGYVAKPFQPEEILARVRALVQLRRLERELESRVRSRAAQLEEANDALRSELAEQRRARAALERSNRVHRALAQIHRELAHAGEEDGFLREICRIAVRECGYRAAWIALSAQGPSAGARAAAQAGFGEDFLSRAQASLSSGALDLTRAAAAVAFEPLAAPSSACPWQAEARRAGCGAFAAVPLVSGGLRLGALLVCAESPGAVDPGEAQLLEEMAASLADGVLTVRSQREHRESEERFRILFEQAAVGVAQVESRSGRILRANRRFGEILGYAPDELAGRALPCLKRHSERWSGEGALAAREGGELQVERQCTRKDGQSVWLKLAITPMSPGGGPSGLYIAVAEDVTASKIAEQSRRDSEERLRRFADVSTEGIFFSDAGAIADVNPALAAILRCDGERGVVGRPLHELCGSAEGSSAGLGTRELMLRRSDGEAFPAEVTLREYWYKGRPQIAGSIRDITGRKRAEEERERLMAQAQAASRAKDQFLAVLSHELRNPLAAIQGGVEMLWRSAVGGDPRAKRALEIVERNARLQMRLVDDLLDLARFTRGKIVLRRARVRLDEVVLAAVQASRADAASAGIQLKAGAAPELWVDADPDRLQQIVLNLLSNALKFTPSGGAVTVTVSPHGASGRLVIEDTGIGIEPGRLPRLFRMFEQGEVGARRAPGLGIGLALVRLIAELHEGRVWAESPGAGRGSRFFVELPLREAPAQAIAPEVHAADRRLIHVALVEDNEDARAVLAEMLEMLDYRVFTAGDAAEAVRLLEEKPVDILLADIGLPDMDGYDFLRSVHRVPRFAHLPAFAVSGYGQESDARRAREAGYLAHFVKPVDISALDRRIRECVGECESEVALH